MQFYSAITIIWIIAAYITSYADFHSATSAVQQAAAAAMGAISMMLPYMLLRISSYNNSLKNQKKIIDLLSNEKTHQ